MAMSETFTRPRPDKQSITVTINGQQYAADVEPRKLLADFIREECGLTGTHLGCEHGVCGSCTVLMNDRPVRSCLIFAVQADGTNVLTVEGLAKDGELNTLQKAFMENHGLQCGFCTPGMLITATDLLRRNPNPTEHEIREGISGNLCRCTGYNGIVKAIQSVAEETKSS